MRNAVPGEDRGSVTGPSALAVPVPGDGLESPAQTRDRLARDVADAVLHGRPIDGPLLRSYELAAAFERLVFAAAVKEACEEFETAEDVELPFGDES